MRREEGKTQFRKRDEYEYENKKGGEKIQNTIFENE